MSKKCKPHNCSIINEFDSQIMKSYKDALDKFDNGADIKDIRKWWKNERSKELLFFLESTLKKRTSSLSKNKKKK